MQPMTKIHVYKNDTITHAVLYEYSFDGTHFTLESPFGVLHIYSDDREVAIFNNGEWSYARADEAQR